MALTAAVIVCVVIPAALGATAGTASPSTFSAGWKHVATGGPPPRYGQAVASDPKDGYILMTGGLRNGAIQSALVDTWTYAGGTWHNLSLTQKPPASYGASMTYDAADGYVLLFGGCYPISAGCSTKTWTFSGGNWTALATRSPPDPSLEWPAMAYDAKDGYVVMFGGAGSGCSGHCSQLSGSTWTYSNGTWRNITSGTHPSARYGAMMAYDPDLGKIVLFGGGINPPSCAGTCSLGDTWEFTGGSWTNVTPSHSPPARYGGGEAYDALAKSLVLFGGRTYSSALNDTWQFHRGVWSAINTSAAPPGTYTPSIAPNPTYSAVVLVTSAISNPTWSKHVMVVWRLA